MHLKYTAIYCFLASAFIIPQGDSTAPFCPTSSQVPPSCVNALTDYQYASAKITPDGTKLVKDSGITKNDIAYAGHLAGQRSQISLTLKGHAYVNHPSGSELFPSNGGLAGALDGVISAIKNAGHAVRTITTVDKTSTQPGATKTLSAEVSHFVPLFRKLQFMILNDLYVYLTAVYSAFSMTHVNILDAGKAEATTAFNKKSLIVDHLLNVIQSQMFFICSHHQPLIPRHLGLKTGSLMLKHDATVDPLFLLKDLDSPFFPGDLATPDQKDAHAQAKMVQSTYLSTLKTIFNFFTTYTNYLTQPDPSSKFPGSNAFFSLAKQVAHVIDSHAFNVEAKKIAAGKGDVGKFVTNSSQAISTQFGLTFANANSMLPNTSSKINKLRALRAKTPAINPPLFSYNAESLRAFKVIPQAARELPANVQSVDWPSTLVAAATSSVKATTAPPESTPLGYQVAYFTDASGNITTSQASAAHLFINLPTANGPYAQEVKRQPDWLNSSQGVISILRACLGDYSQLVGKGILQPCTEAIVCKTLGLSCPQIVGITLVTCAQQLNAVNQTQQQYISNAKLGTQQTGGNNQGQ